MILDHAINEFFNHCLYEKNLSPKTIKFYRIDLAQFCGYITDNNLPVEVSLIGKTELKPYLKVLSCWKPKTIKRKIATLKAFFNYLEYEDIILVNPIRKLKIKIKEPNLLPKAMTSGEASAMLGSVYQSLIGADQDKFAHFQSLRNIVVIELLFATGGRVSEIAGLQRNALDLNTGTVTIFGKGGKERKLQICNPDTLFTLTTYCELYKDKIIASGDYLLVNRLNHQLSAQSIRYLVKDLAIKLKFTKKVTPHVFRHTFATLLLENDVDVKYIQSLLGHSSIMTTQIYTQVNSEKQKRILAEKHPRMGFSMALAGCE